MPSLTAQCEGLVSTWALLPGGESKLICLHSSSPSSDFTLNKMPLSLQPWLTPVLRPTSLTALKFQLTLITLNNPLQISTINGSLIGKAQEALQQGYIVPSTSPASVGFFVEKKGDGLGPCLNQIRVKYPLLLLPSALEQLHCHPVIMDRFSCSLSSCHFQCSPSHLSWLNLCSIISFSTIPRQS